MESWRTVPSMPYYRVSSQGKVMNKFGRVLRPNMINGYTCLTKRGKSHRIHRLMAEAFNLPRPANASVINHKDQNKANNTIENLEWITQAENMRQYWDHCAENGIKRGPQRLGFYEQESGQVYIFNSYGEAAKFFGVSLATLWGGVQDCCKSETRKFHGFVIRKLDKDNNIVE